MKKTFLSLLSCLMIFNGLQARTIYVSTTGSDSNPGSKDAPFATPNKAVDEVQPGDTIFLRGGTYMLTAGIKVKAQQNARPDARIYMWGYQEEGKTPEKVVIDGSQIATSTEAQFKMARCIYHNHEANYWHYKNLELCNAKDNGMKMEGSYNIIENCKFYGNNDTGLQIGMYKDFAIEETKSLPSGEPQFNPGFQFCRGNIVINCDSYYNYDSKTWNGGSDDGGDADGFACKLFPGPGTEFHGCRAWNNSDDNWDLYMVYHPIVIDNCWSYKAGYDKNGTARQNGNGFKLGGGGTSGGVGFDQSVGAHVVTRCVSFGSLHKGFDQNNAYEAMYLFNNLSFNNEYNYRFPTEFLYGTMYMRNNIGFGASKENHEFLSEDKPGYKAPNTDYNSWTTLDGCSPIKESTKVGGKTVKTKDYSSEFLSLSVTDFMADRQIDGSLPRNNFARIKTGSVFIDKGVKIENFEAKTHLPESEQAVGYAPLKNITIPFIGSAPDFGAYEVGDPVFAKLTNTTNNKNQRVFTGTPIVPIVFKYEGDGVTGAEATNLPAGLMPSLDTKTQTLTISGIPTTEGTYTVTTLGSAQQASVSGEITIAMQMPATLTCTSDNSSQTPDKGRYIKHIEFVWGGGAEDVKIENLPEGLEYVKDVATNKVIIHGLPTTDGKYTISTIGGDGVISISGTITIVAPTQILSDWYNFQDAVLPENIAAFLSKDETSLITTNYAGAGACSVGALQLVKGTGYMKLTLPNGLESLKMRYYLTGDRQLTVKYGKTGTENTWTSGDSKSIKSGNAEYDLVSKIPALRTKDPIVVNVINTRSDGGNFNIHDLYVASYAEVVWETEDPAGTPKIATSIETEKKDNPTFSLYQTETAVVVSGEIASLQLYNMSGSLVSSSQRSQIVSTAGLAPGVYIIRIVSAEGYVSSQKVLKK